MSVTKLIWMLAICSTLLSCGRSNRDIEKTSIENPTNPSETIAVDEADRHSSVEDLRKIAKENLRVGLGSDDVCQALKAHGLSVVAMAGSGVSATQYFGSKGLFDPVLVVTYRRERQEFHAIEWAVEDKATPSEE